MKSCLECKKYEGCKAPCAKVEAHVNDGYVGHGRSSVYIQGPGFEVGQDDWLDWIYMNEGIEWPEAPVDHEDIDNLNIDIFSDIQIRALIDRFVHGMQLKDIAKREGVSRAAIGDRIKSGGKSIKRYMKCRSMWDKVKPLLPDLTETKQKVAFLRYHEGMPSAKVAKIMGVSDNNVRWHLNTMGV
jgi:DNA-directed RNA polymerase specialized sigma24 family protein